MSFHKPKPVSRRYKTLVWTYLILICLILPALAGVPQKLWSGEFIRVYQDFWSRLKISNYR